MAKFLTFPDPDPLSRILDPGSWIPDPGSRILDPGSWIPDLGSRISDLGYQIPYPTTATTEKGGNICCSTFIYGHKYH